MSFKKGDFVYVSYQGEGGNNVRARAGAGEPYLCTLPVGTVMVIVDGPVRAGGMTWWKVYARQGCYDHHQKKGEEKVTGWTSEGKDGERWILPLSPKRDKKRDCTGLTTFLRRGQQAYVQDPVEGRNEGNNVREKGDPQASKLGKIPVGGLVRIVGGPTCEDGMVWWKVQSEADPSLRGWTSEGSADEGAYLVPLRVAQQEPEPRPVGAEKPTFTGRYKLDDGLQAELSFSPDGEVATVFFENLNAETSDGTGQHSDSMRTSLALEVDSGGAPVRVRQDLEGYVDLSSGTKVGIKARLGNKEITRTTDKSGASDFDGRIESTLAADEDYRARLHLKVERASRQDWAYLVVDALEVTLERA